MLRLDRAGDDRAKLAAERIQIDAVAQLLAESVNCRLGVVAGPVEAPVDGPLDHASHRTERAGHGEGRERDRQGAGRTGECAQQRAGAGDRAQEQPDERQGQRRVHERAADDHVDLVQPVAKHGDGDSYRDQADAEQRDVVQNDKPRRLVVRRARHQGRRQHKIDQEQHGGQGRGCGQPFDLESLRRSGATEPDDQADRGSDHAHREEDDRVLEDVEHRLQRTDAERVLHSRELARLDLARRQDDRQRDRGDCHSACDRDPSPATAGQAAVREQQQQEHRCHPEWGCPQRAAERGSGIGSRK